MLTTPPAKLHVLEYNRSVLSLHVSYFTLIIQTSQSFLSKANHSTMVVTQKHKA